MIRRPPRSTLFPTRRSSDLGRRCILKFASDVLVICADGLVPLSKRSEEHTSELQSLAYLVCRLLLEKKKKKKIRVSAPGSPPARGSPTKCWTGGRRLRTRIT